MFGRYHKSGHHPDYFLLALFAVLTIAGLVILSSASSDLGKIRFNDSYYYFKHQITRGLIPGIIGFFLASRIYYQRYRKFALILLVLSLVLLTLVFTKFGLSKGGASRWLTLGSLSFQPAELLKLTFIIYLAAWFSKNKPGARGTPGGLIVFLIMSILVGGLLILEPATSTVVVLLGAGFAIYFLSGASLKHVLGAIVLGAIALGFIIYSTPYRLERVLTFLNPGEDLEGSGFHLKEAQTAIGTGGLFGVGYGESKSKVSTLPAAIGDSIFAVAAEEFGFVGAGIIVALFAALTFRLFWLAKKMGDRFGQLLLTGFATIFALQSAVNIGAISGLIPLTGIPLPFVSYGGTALAVFLTISGLTLNISKYTH
ncbi:MAG: cell division protein FtsW [Candidatus Liptonbacteria bacterium]|nr:cell division protein FtsW [Candidatus Liptonbacteria bacterium]